ncbi:TPA: dihydroorotate oxidase, partial [Enterococcus faecium]
MSLETTFANHIFANPLMNASGVHCMTTQELDELAHSEAGAFITKSCTINERKVNPEPRYFDVPLGSINSMGLPNLGFSYYLEYALAYEKVQENQNQPLFFSIAGMSVQENLEMLEKIEKS